MIRFILNDNDVNSSVAPGSTLLDFIRYEQYLTGTKIGCREGDCGACTILVGELVEGEMCYSNVTSCLMPVANANGKHIVTIEGINGNELNPVQHAFAEEGATQCGFCTPGFIMSLTGYSFTADEPDYEGAIASVNGNICRCTGYKSIQRAADRVVKILNQRDTNSPIDFAIANGFIPQYFKDIPGRLKKIQADIAMPMPVRSFSTKMGGGTDLFVQRHDTLPDEDIDFLFDRKDLNQIKVKGNDCFFGSGVTASDIEHSPVFKEAIPEWNRFIKLVSSTPIRHMGTVAGNFMNASPIGDFSIFFLALDARLQFSHADQCREIPLRKLYKGYKSLDKLPEETLHQISFELPSKGDHFNFEKVCKRTYLDIASVNSALHLKMDGLVISKAGLSAGGVGPVPMFLEKSSAFLMGKPISESLVTQLIAIVQEEITPISDVRGTESYKRLLLSQLIKAHFIRMFPAMEASLMS